jgi:probable selenium-dependent hydroxylase accessory protein YqeC
MDIVEALRAESGVVCVVGAGGKKTTLYSLAARTADGPAPKTVVTSTVRIPIFDSQVDRVVTTERPVRAVEDNEDWPLGVVPARDGEDRYRGYDTAVVDDLSASGSADRILVKADGARTREFKAPGENEPQIPERADVVLPIASVQVVGQPLTADAVHRPERVAAVANVDPGERIGVEDVAAVLASPDGGHRGVPPDATVLPLLNKVDDDEWASLAREVADAIHERANVPYVVLASMVADEPLVAVVS